MNSKCNSQDFVKGFIEIYKQHKCLWKLRDRSSRKSYTDKVLRSKALEELLEYYRSHDPSASKETVCSKIDNLLNVFRKELVKVMQSKREAASPGGDVYKPKLWYYDLLLFTVDQGQSREAASSTEAVDSDDAQDDDHEHKMTMSRKSEGPKRYWCLKHKLFLVDLIRTFPEVIDCDPRRKSMRSWTRISRKLKNQFGWNIPAAKIKIRWEIMRKRTETLMDQVKTGTLSELKEPDKSIEKLIRPKSKLNVNNNDEAKRVDVSAEEFTKNRCVECGEMYDRCSRCHSTSPFNINGHLWVDDWLNRLRDDVSDRCEDDRRGKGPGLRMNESRRKSQREETRLSRELMALRTKAQKLKLEIVEFQHQEALIKVETAKIKRTLMEYVVSERVYVPDDSLNDSVVI